LIIIIISKKSINNGVDVRFIFRNYKPILKKKISKVKKKNKKNTKEFYGGFLSSTSSTPQTP
jgi:hypothetical protein